MLSIDNKIKIIKLVILFLKKNKNQNLNFSFNDLNIFHFLSVRSKTEEKTLNKIYSIFNNLFIEDLDLNIFHDHVLPLVNFRNSYLGILLFLNFYNNDIVFYFPNQAIAKQKRKK